MRGSRGESVPVRNIPADSVRPLSHEIKGAGSAQVGRVGWWRERRRERRCTRSRTAHGRGWEEEGRRAEELEDGGTRLGQASSPHGPALLPRRPPRRRAPRGPAPPSRTPPRGQAQARHLTGRHTGERECADEHAAASQAASWASVRTSGAPPWDLDAGSGSRRAGGQGRSDWG